jgi:hypothetical protein
LIQDDLQKFYLSTQTQQMLTLPPPCPVFPDTLTQAVSRHRMPA